jgi:hypothetical protein
MIADATGAVIVDKDIVKSPLVEAELPDEKAGSLSYEVLMGMARHLLEQGNSVVLDSPAYFPEIVADGRQVAEDAGAAYLIIECECKDKDELERRLKTRERMPSQIDQVVDDPYERPGTAPISEPKLLLDTSGELEDALPEALAYIREQVGGAAVKAEGRTP